MDVGIIAVWIIQLVIMSIFDTRKGALNLALNVVALVTSSVLTYFWGGLLWLLVSVLVIPIFAGLLAGTVGGFYAKHKEKRGVQND